MHPNRQTQESRSKKPATAPRTSPSKRKPGAPPERVLCACGHEDTNRRCGACRNAAIAAKAAKSRQKREAKILAKGQTNEEGNRLPDGAAFTVGYDAAAKTWAGKLTIGQAVFEGRASGVFRLLKNLDAAFRAGQKAS